MNALRSCGSARIDLRICYTWGRKHTFFEDDLDAPVHVDFTSPYDSALGSALLRSAARAGIAVTAGGAYACTQGPRLESAAEVDRLERDGCDIVGMTGMPEAALAREAGIAYAHLAIVVNAAAGRAPGPIRVEDMAGILAASTGKVRQIIRGVAASQP